MALKRFGRVGKWCFGAAALFLVFRGCSAEEEPQRIPSRFLIPNGYLGTIRVDYNVKSAPPLSQRDGYYIYHIPISGYLKTSTQLQEGWAMDEYYYVNGKHWTALDGKQDETGMMWGDGTSFPGDGGTKDTPVVMTFFIGTQAQFNFASQFPHPIGPLPQAAFQAWLKGRNLSNKNLTKHNLSKAKLRGAFLLETNLSGANLQKADLSYAIMESNLSGANLQGANLYGATVRSANLRRADLRYTNLREAQLQGADLTDAKLQGADLRGTQYDTLTKWPRGFDARKQGAVVKVGLSSMIYSMG